MAMVKTKRNRKKKKPKKKEENVYLMRWMRIPHQKLMVRPYRMGDYGEKWDTHKGNIRNRFKKQ